SYWLKATAPGLGAATSGTFTITAAVATQLVFGVQPTTTAAGHQIAPAVKIRAFDAFGNFATGFTGNVSVALGSNPGGGTLSGTTSVAAVNGVASFGDLSITKTGPSYWLTATATGLSRAASNNFPILPGPATQLVFAVQPTTITGGTIFSPTVKVRALDALGNVATDFSGDVHMELGVSPSGQALQGTTTVTAVNGVATFLLLSVNAAAFGYTLAASSAA